MNFVRSCICAIVMTAAAVHAQSPDEQYIRIYQTIQEADRLNDAKQPREAAAKYIESQQALKRFQNLFPSWNERVINYRLSYVTSRLEPLLAQSGTPAPAPTNVPPTTAVTPSPTPVTPAPAETAPPAPREMPVTAPPVAPPSADMQQQVAALQQELEQLRAENTRLGAKLKEALSVQPAAVDPRELARAEERIRGLEKENELMKVRLRVVTSAPAVAAPGESVAELKTKLAEQNDAIVALRAENEVLKKARETVSPGAAAMANDTQMLESLRSRLAVLEAKPVPFTAEELALMSKAPALAPAVSATTLVASANTGTLPPAEGTPKKASKELPPGAGPLVAAAERAFAARNYDEAEKKYLDVLRQDENNVSILANLASVQLELGKISEAEATAMKALNGDSNDYFALYVLGRIRFHQDKIDEAFEVLSRSAKANPEYAETQNYLGIVLSEKGMRAPAEAALRRAVQLQPNHPAAHNNLAVVYATQKPPALALAKWHYQKAVAAGHARNAELEKLLEGGR